VHAFKRTWIHLTCTYQDLASLQYALNMHVQSPYAQPQTSMAASLPTPSSAHSHPTLAPNAWNFRMFRPAPEISPHLGPSYPSTFPYPASPSACAYTPASYPAQPFLPQMQQASQLGPDFLARYAEFQLQQNHQRQQRALLERQRQQLAELGVPVEDKSLLDDIFGTGAAGGGGGGSIGETGRIASDPGFANGSGGEEVTGGGEFIWPTVSSRRIGGGRSNGFPGEEQEGAWRGLGAGELEPPFPDPHSAGVDVRRDKRGREGGHAMVDKRARVG
jgi:MADS-box transcription factor